MEKIVEVTEEELAMLVKMRERAKEQQKPQEEEKTFTFTVKIDNEIIGNIKVDKKQNKLLDWLFNNGCFYNGVDFETGSLEIVDFTK